MSEQQQQQLYAFAEWLPTRHPEFEGMTQDQIIQVLNKLSETDEGLLQVQQYMNDFQEELNSKEPKLKAGGKINAFICKHAKGGRVDCGCTQKAQDGGLVRASAYYANHANEGIIRKLQNFLSARGYDLGDAGIDGKFGQKTYEAIKQYQRDNGLVDDGMWGEDTNLVHRVLGAGDTTFNGPRSGAHPGKHTFTQSYKGQTSYAIPEQEDAYLRNVTNRAYNDANWFWGDTDDAKAARDFLYKRNGGNEFIQDIYENYTSPELQQKIAYSKLPTNVQQTRYNQGISDAVSDAGKTGAKVGAVIGGTMLAAEAIPAAIEYAPQVMSSLRNYGQFLRNSANDLAKAGYRPTGAVRTGTTHASQGFAGKEFAGKEASSYLQAILENGASGAPTASSSIGWAKPFIHNALATGFENGGKVASAQNELPIAKDAKSGRKAAERNTVKVADNGIAKKRRVGAAMDKSGGQHVYEGSTIRGNWADTWASVPTPGDTVVIQRIPVASGNDTSTRTYPMGSDEYNSVMSRMRPLFKGFFPTYKTGGKIEKAQKGSVIDYYRNKWSNDYNRVKQGWNKFKESAPGKVWNAFMPNPNSETGMIGAFTPGTTFVARIPKQKPTIRISENLGNGKFSAIDDFGRTVLYDAERDKGLFQVIDKNDIIWKSGKDWDIDLPMIKSNYNIPDLNNIIKFSWPKFIGRNVLLPASGVVGSAAAGSYVATKKDKNKKSENK